MAVADGKILAVGPASECNYEADQVLGGPDHLVLPGLVNVHAHLVQGCIRSMAEGTTFEERLFGFYYPMTGACDEERSYVSAMPPILDLVRRGATTTADDHFTHVHKRSIDGVLKATRDAGMRCRMARLMINDPDAVPDGFREDLDTGLAETERVKAEWEDELTSVTASTIGITYCEPEQLKAIWEWTDAHTTDSSTSTPRRSWMASIWLSGAAGRGGPSSGSTRWASWRPTSSRPTPRTVRPGEAELIRDRGARIALVPDMEQVLVLVNFDARQYIDQGVICGIGLDGPVVAYGHDLWTALRGLLVAQRMGDEHRKQLAQDKPHWTGDEMLYGSAELALELATIGGARALMMDEQIGSLEPGKDADILMIDRSGETQLSPPAALIANLVYGNGPSPDAVARVMVRGRTVVANGEHVSIDRREAVRQSDQLQEMLLDEVDARRFVRMRSRFSWVGP